MSFPVLTSGSGQIGTGLLYSNVVYFPTHPSPGYGPRTVSWTVPAGVTTCRVRLWGGGGSSRANVTSGGGGGFALKTVTGLTPGTTVTVTIGNGGSNGSNPGTGGTSSFGAYVSATGGRNTPCTGGAGSGGDINMNGSAAPNFFFGGNAGNLFIPFTGVSTTEILNSSETMPALTLMANPTNPLDKIGTGYLFGLPSKAMLGYNLGNTTSVLEPWATHFGNGAGGSGNAGATGTYPGGGSATNGSSSASGGSGLVIVEY